MRTREELPKNIVLIGFMGCGKSTIGRELHERLGYELIDIDQAIEAAVGKTIVEIFQEEGELTFRDYESFHLQEIARQNDLRHIISTGGGIVARPDNRHLLKKMGYVVWLNTSEEVIFERTSRNRDRPLLNHPDARERISRLMAEREPWYRETAHLVVDTKGLTSGELATGILESARYFFSHSS